MNLGLALADLSGDLHDLVSVLDAHAHTTIAIGQHQISRLKAQLPHRNRFVVAGQVENTVAWHPSVSIDRQTDATDPVHVTHGTLDDGTYDTESFVQRRHPIAETGPATRT
jgi:hypothetical protein